MTDTTTAGLEKRLRETLASHYEAVGFTFKAELVRKRDIDKVPIAAMASLCQQHADALAEKDAEIKTVRNSAAVLNAFIEKQRDALAKARVALAPFAEFAEKADEIEHVGIGKFPDDQAVTISTGQWIGTAFPFRFFRRARTALSRIKGEEG